VNKKTSPDELNQILYQFFEYSSDGFRVMDEFGTILFVNNAFCKIVKMDAVKLTGSPFSIIYTEPERAETLEIYTQDMMNKSIQPFFEIERTLWNNEKIWLEFSNALLPSGNSKFHLVSVIRDITQRKVKESIELQRKTHLDHLIKNIPDVLFITGLSDENKFENFKEANDSACNQLLYTQNEIKELSLYKISSSRFQEIFPEIISRLLRKKQTVFEIDIISKDRRIVPFEFNANFVSEGNQRTVILAGRDITGRKRAEEKLTNSREQLRNLASRLQAIREEERKMIAREIHDELGQLLTVLKIQIALIAGKLPKDNSDIENKIQSAVLFIDKAVNSVQKITEKLRPGILDELGLIPAIEWQAQEFQERTGITCYCSTIKENLKLEPEQSTALFRILQEALTNVARHSLAKKVSIYLKKENDSLTLEITDNGIGIRDAQIRNPKSFGLMGIKERAMVFGGNVTIRGVQNQGTNLKIEMPIRQYKL
jgi:PAS domain S-box-containing protein